MRLPDRFTERIFVAEKYRIPVIYRAFSVDSCVLMCYIIFHTKTKTSEVLLLRFVFFSGKFPGMEVLNKGV